MAVVLNAGAGGATAATDTITGEEVQLVKLTWGNATTATRVDAGGSALPVQGTVTVNAGTGTFTVGGTVTVTQATAANLNATVTGNVGITGAVDTELTTADLDTGAGTDTRAVMGVVLAASGGGLLLGSANPMPVSDNGGSLTVDGTVSIGGAVDTELPAAAVLADNAANPTVPGVGAFALLWDGATWDRSPGNSTDGTLVNLGANNDVTVTNTVTVTGTVNLGSAVDTELPAAAALADAMSNPTVPAVGSFLVGYNGTTWDRLRTDTTNGLDVDVTRVQGSVTVAQATAANLNATVTGTVTANAGTGTMNVAVLSIAAGSNNIGDVDVLSVVPGTGATNLGKAEDAGHVDGDTGVMALGVRRTADTSTAGLDGDYQPFLFDDNGFLKVNIKAGAGSGGTAMTDDAAFTVGTTSFTPAGGTFRSVRDLVEDNDGGAFAMTQRRAILSAIETPAGDSAMDDTNDAVRVNVVAGSGGGVSHTDDAAFTPAVSAVVPAAGMFDDVTPDSVDEGDAGIVRMSANRNLYVRIRDNAGNERGLNIDASGNANTIVNNTVTVTGTVTANAGTGTFTVDSELPAAAVLADNAANPTAPAVGAFAMVWDGSTWDRAPGTSVDGQLVNLGANNDVTVTGTVTANAGTGTFTVGDGGGSLTVDGSVSITGAVDTELTTADLDTGAGTDTRAVVGLVLAASGGGLLVGSANPLPVSDNGGSLTIDGSVSITGAVDTELPAAAALADNTANPTVPAVGAFTMLWDGATWDRAAGTSVDGALVNLGANNDVTVTSGTVTANAGTGTFTTGGINAHDVAVSGNPVRIGARANLNEPTAVSADGDVTELWSDRLGRLVVLEGHSNPELPTTVNLTASGDSTVIAAPGAGVSLYICRASVHNRGAANVVVALRDGAAGTIRWRAELASEGGGVSPLDFGSVGWKLTANTAFVGNLSATGDVDVNVLSYYIAA